MGDLPQPILAMNTRGCVFERVDIMMAFQDKIVKYRTCCTVVDGAGRAGAAGIYRGSSQRLGRTQDGHRELLGPREEDLQGARDSTERGRAGGLPTVSGRKAPRLQ